MPENDEMTGFEQLSAGTAPRYSRDNAETLPRHPAHLAEMRLPLLNRPLRNVALCCTKNFFFSFRVFGVFRDPSLPSTVLLCLSYFPYLSSPITAPRKIRSNLANIGKACPLEQWLPNSDDRLYEQEREQDSC